MFSERSFDEGSVEEGLVVLRADQLEALKQRLRLGRDNGSNAQSIAPVATYIKVVVSLADMNGVRRGSGRGGAVGGAQLDISVQTRTCPASPGADGTVHTKVSSRAERARLTERDPSRAQRHRQVADGPDGPGA